MPEILYGAMGIWLLKEHFFYFFQIHSWQNIIHTGTTSTDAAGKMSWYSRHNRGKSTILLQYSFAPAIISSLLSCTKMVNIAATGIIFTTKIHQNAFAHRIPPGELHRLIVGWGNATPIPDPTSMTSASQFSVSVAPQLSPPRHAAMVLIIKSGRLWVGTV